MTMVVAQPQGWLKDAPAWSSRQARTPSVELTLQPGAAAEVAVVLPLARIDAGQHDAGQHPAVHVADHARVRDAHHVAVEVAVVPVHRVRQLIQTQRRPLVVTDLTPAPLRLTRPCTVYLAGSAPTSSTAKSNGDPHNASARSHTIMHSA